MNRARKSSPPPFYWKVPVAEKDYMSQNYRKMRTIAAEGLKKRSEPLKAHFVPGVTKNSKYAHVQSKVGQFLKGQGQPIPQGSYADELADRRFQQSQRFSVNGNVQASQKGSGNTPVVQRRLSRSSTDLRTQHAPPTLNNLKNRREGSTSAINVPPPARQSLSQPEFPTVRILEPNPPDESIYKWRFSDDPPFHSTNNDSNNREQCIKYPQQHCHRVEYLPCDGICAEETVVDNGNPDSARSNSSRTSRGCNTEETRIFADSSSNVQSNPQVKPYRHPIQQSEFQNVDDGATRMQMAPAGISSQTQFAQPKKKSIYTVNGFNNDAVLDDDDNYVLKRNRSSQDFNIITGKDLETQMGNLGIRSFAKTKPRNGTVGPSGDLPHSLGTVPKYLKQRQEEWKVEEAAKKEAEKNAHIPPGYMLMSEDERLESLKSFKKNYDMLIAELNRIPIRIDTMRVRDHKVQLEKQLTRLEEAMKSFSRPKVWVKTDD